MRRRLYAALLCACASLAGCSIGARIFLRNAEALVRGPRAVSSRVTEPRRSDARVSALWVGHATVLLQIDDKFVLTDPVFTEFAGPLSRRLVQPGIAVEHLPPLDLVAISHAHVDHLSVASLDMIERKVRDLVVPRGALVYVPDYRFDTHAIALGESFERDGLRATAVAVMHPSYRFGVDSAWVREAACGWIFQYHGLTVFFGGDTAYDRAVFERVARVAPSIDLALLPIAPVEERAWARHTHIDGREAIDVLLTVQARVMVPIHYDTFAHGIDPPGYAVRVLRDAMRARSVPDERVRVLSVGEQAVIVPR